MSELSETSPNSRFGTISIILMFAPVLAVALLSFVLEPIVSSLSNAIQRAMMVMTLLVPAQLGFLFAIIITAQCFTTDTHSLPEITKKMGSCYWVDHRLVGKPLFWSIGAVCRLNLDSKRNS